MPGNNYKSTEPPNGWWNNGEIQTVTGTTLALITNNNNNNNNNISSLMNNLNNNNSITNYMNENENTGDDNIWNVFLLSLGLFVMGFIMITAILGNMLVILSVIRVRKLRNTTNIFIVSLAMADIMVAISAMSFNFSVQAAGKWLFSRFLCDLWNSLDVYFSTASIIHLCCISVDRYWAICKPLKYPTFMTKRVVRIMLCITWLSPALLSFVPIFSGMYTTPEHREYVIQNPNKCEFVVNDSYVIISSSISFWIPCSIMICTYFAIFREATRQEKALMQRQGNAILLQRQSSVTGETSAEILNGSSRTLNRNDDEHTPTKDRRNYSKIKREYKAAKTLGIIMGLFTLCWLPFFLWYVSTTICGPKNCPCPDIVVVILFWIGYFNSTLNPFIYAYFNREFRDAFRDTLSWIFCKMCFSHHSPLHNDTRRGSLRSNNRRKSTYTENYLKPNNQNRRIKVDSL